MFCRNVHYQLVSCRLALKYYIPSFAGFPLQLTQGPLLVPLTPVWEHNSKSLHLFLASSFISTLVTFSISPLCHPVFLSLLPVSLTLNTIRLHRHPLTSSQPRRYPRTSAPNYHHHHLLLLQRACMYSPPSQLRWRDRKTRCQFGLDLIQVRAPYAPRLCYSDCFLNQLCTGTDRGGKESWRSRRGREGAREGSGTSNRKSLHRTLPWCHATFTRDFFPSVQQASCNMRCNVKDNSWLLIPTCRRFFFFSFFFFPSDVCSHKVEPTLCTIVRPVQLRQVWAETSQKSESRVSVTFHFVI